jgi:predicted lipoprotein with Yx(FWY)xxD motif
MFHQKSLIKNEKLYWLLGLFLAAALTLSACQPNGGDIADTGEQEATNDGDVLVRVENHLDLGEILVDENGKTLYIFTNDAPNQSNCTGECLTNWPPLITEGNPQAGPGPDSNRLGAAPLEDGSLITTFNQRPLYYWFQDTEPGHANGQGVGGVWFAVSPAGEPVGQ